MFNHNTLRPHNYCPLYLCEESLLRLASSAFFKLMRRIFSSHTFRWRCCCCCRYCRGVEIVVFLAVVVLCVNFCINTRETVQSAYSEDSQSLGGTVRRYVIPSLNKWGTHILCQREAERLASPPYLHTRSLIQSSTRMHVRRHCGTIQMCGSVRLFVSFAYLVAIPGVVVAVFRVTSAATCAATTAFCCAFCGFHHNMLLLPLPA